MCSGDCWGNLTECWGVTCDGLASHPGGEAIPLTASCYRNWTWAPAAIWQLGLKGLTYYFCLKSLFTWASPLSQYSRLVISFCLRFPLQRHLIFYLTGKCWSRSLLLEKPFLLHKPCAHSAETHKMETLTYNGEPASFMFLFSFLAR